MRVFLNSLICASVLALTAPAVVAQDTANPETAAENPVANDPTISMGEDVSKIGKPYNRETFGDWVMHCVTVPEGQKEPCWLFQLLKDANGSPVAGIEVLFLVSEQGQAVVANITTPLETLLTPQLRFAIDGGGEKRYPFTFCTPNECIARLGFSPEDVASMKRGAKATITIVPLQAPTSEVALDVSLTGFTAGFDSLFADATAQ